MKTKNEGINILKAHVALYVGDVDASVGFYSKMFGFEPSKVRTGYAKFDVTEPPLNLSLNQAIATGKGPLSHMGIQVASTEDVELMKRRWEDSGLSARDELQTTCCYALQDKAWVNDPDGNEWEVFAVLEDNLGEDARKGAGASCCKPSPVGIGSVNANVSCC